MYHGHPIGGHPSGTPRFNRFLHFLSQFHLRSSIGAFAGFLGWLGIHRVWVRWWGSGDFETGARAGVFVLFGMQIHGSWEWFGLEVGLDLILNPLRLAEELRGPHCDAAQRPRRERRGRRGLLAGWRSGCFAGPTRTCLTLLVCTDCNPLNRFSPHCIHMLYRFRPLSI